GNKLPIHGLTNELKGAGCSREAEGPAADNIEAGKISARCRPRGCVKDSSIDTHERSFCCRNLQSAAVRNRSLRIWSSHRPSRYAGAFAPAVQVGYMVPFAGGDWLGGLKFTYKYANIDSKENMIIPQTASGTILVGPQAPSTGPYHRVCRVGAS